jgi:hypothetical protein
MDDMGLIIRHSIGGVAGVSDLWTGVMKKNVGWSLDANKKPDTF